MTRHKGPLSGNRRGFALIEVIVAVAISGVVGGGITVATIQVLDVNARSTVHMTVLNDVESAVHWITRDAQMAQTVNLAGPAGLPLTLTWIEWNGTSHNVTYRVQNSELQRSYSQNQSQPVTAVVAHHINVDPQMTNVQNSDGTLVFRITAAIGGFRPGSETRLFKVFPRTAR